MNSNELVPCFSSHVCLAFAFLIKLSSTQTLSSLAFTLPILSPLEGEWASSCMKLDCWLGLKHDSHRLIFLSASVLTIDSDDDRWCIPSPMARHWFTMHFLPCIPMIAHPIPYLLFCHFYFKNLPTHNHYRHPPTLCQLPLSLGTSQTHTGRKQTNPDLMSVTSLLSHFSPCTRAFSRGQDGAKDCAWRVSQANGNVVFLKIRCFFKSLWQGYGRIGLGVLSWV